MTSARADQERRGPPLSGWWPDLLFAAVLTLLLALVSGHLPPAAGGRAVDGFGYVLLVGTGTALGIARRQPRMTLAVVAIGTGCYIALRYPNGPILATGWLALVVLSWRTDRRTAVIGAAALCAALAVAVLVIGRDIPLPLFYLGWSAGAVFLGDVVRNRRDHLAELEERARYLERTREEETRRRIAEDRLRIARDLHDSVAHTMATINVQAGAAAHVLDRRPGAAKEALAAIQRASGDVLDELGAMLSLLRDSEESAARAPTPGLDQVHQLIDTTRQAGLRVSWAVEGPVDLVPAPVGTAAYRVIQESLTNVLRHAGATVVTVTVRAGRDRSLVVEVCDDGAGAGDSSVGTGIGIRGMRERTESTGGRLEAGPGPRPGPGPGYVVRAAWDGRT